MQKKSFLKRYFTEMAEVVTCEKEFHYEEKDFVSDLFFFLFIYLFHLNNSK